MSDIKFSGSKMFSEVHPSSWVVPQESPLKVKSKKANLQIGVPKETYRDENRVPLTPEAVNVLVANGHTVYIEQGAGEGSSYSDKAYSDSGAFICYSQGEIYQKSDFIIKVSPLSDDELSLLRQGQRIFSAVNLGGLTPDYLKALVDKSVAAMGFEFLQSADGSLPIVQMMSEIAGVSSVHIASELLCGTNGGKGLLLGGITGVPPAVVTIIGSGTVGFNAAQTALSMGAMVKVIDREVSKLRRLEKELGVNIWTAVSLHKYVEEAVLSSDVVIGAAFTKGSRTPVIVTEELVSQMREGSVIVDVAIDQGGCIETSKVTSHENPTFIEHDVIHYCVPNIASRVARTASAAISNIVGQILLKIGDYGGIDGAIRFDEGIKRSLFVYRKHLTKESISSIFGMDFVDIDLLVHSDIS